MDKQQQLNELLQTLNGISKVRDNAEKRIYEASLLPIVQACADKGFKLKIKNAFSVNYCEIAFDLGDWDKEFGTDFTIRLGYNNLIELSHGLLSDTSRVREYIIQRDKIIGRLWDRESELMTCFEKVKAEEDKYYNTRAEIEWQIRELESQIEKEKTDNALKQLVVGSKWVYTYDMKRPLTITKITTKMIYFERNYSSWGDNSKQAKISAMVNDFTFGNLVKYEEENDNEIK